MSYITEPLDTPEKGQAYLDEDGYVSAVVVMDLSAIIDGDLESFLDMASCLLVGDDLLMDVDYKAVGVTEGGSLLVRVTGDPSTSWDFDDEE